VDITSQRGSWLDCDRRGETLAITTTRNGDVAVINEHIQRKRATVGQLDPGTIVPIGDEWAMIGDVVATRHNNRRLRTSRGDHVRNRERWIVTATHPNGDLTVSRLQGHGAITLSADYAAGFVELAYATTEYGAQGITADRSLTLATSATIGRGLYVGMTRGRSDNLALVVTDEPTLEAARDVLEGTLAIDRADIPAVRHRYIDDTPASQAGPSSWKPPAQRGRGREIRTPGLLLPNLKDGSIGRCRRIPICSGLCHLPGEWPNTLRATGQADTGRCISD